MDILSGLITPIKQKSGKKLALDFKDKLCYTL